MFVKSLKTVGVSFALVVATGCASTAVSSREYSEPRETLAAAEQVGAENQKASLHMQYAKENLARADELIDEEEHDRARLYLDRAKADAELALAYATRESTKTELDELEGRIEDLESETL